MTPGMESGSLCDFISSRSPQCCLVKDGRLAGDDMRLPIQFQENASTLNPTHLAETLPFSNTQSHGVWSFTLTSFLTAFI